MLPDELSAADRSVDNRLRTIVAAVALLTLTWLAFLPALHGGPVWDDRPMLTQNAAFTQPHTLRRIWFDLRAVPVYYPLTSTVLFLESKLWGTADLTGYHVVNVLLHGVNALLVWTLMRRLGVRNGYLAAALFALHPVMVESVAWVTELKNTLSGVFFLSSTLIFVTIKPTRTSSLTAAALYVIAMLAKTSAVGLPVVLLVLLWWKRRRPTPPQWVAIGSMLIAGGAMGLVTRWVETNVVGAIGPEWDRSLIERLAVGGPAVLFYIQTLLWPTQLSFIYPMWRLPDHASWQHAVGVLVLAVPALLWAGRSKWGRGPCTAAAVYLLLLAPVLGLFKIFFQRYSFVADHFTYLPAIVVFASFAALLPKRRVVVIPVGVILCAACAVLTWQQSRTFIDDDTVFRHVLSVYSDNWEANSNVGRDLMNAGRLDEAEPYFQRAAATYPQAGEVWFGLGEIAERRKQYDVAMNFYRKAARLRPRAPMIHFNFANMLLINRRVAEAIDEYRTTLDLSPELVIAHDNLGVALQTAHDPIAAEAEFREALTIDPTFAPAQRHLAKLLSPIPTSTPSRKR